MSQSIRRVLAVTGLVAALLLSIPAPSRAAGLRGQAPISIVTRAWSWLESLLASSGPAASAQRLVIQQKDTIQLPIPPPANNGSGSAMDPDGVRR